MAITRRVKGILKKKKTITTFKNSWSSSTSESGLLSKEPSVNEAVN